MNYKLWGLIALVVPALLLTGCRSKDQVGRYTPSEFLMTALDAKRLNYAPRWATNLNDAEKHQSVAYAAALGDLIITIESPSNLVTAINANDGSIRWREMPTGVTQPLYEPNRSGDDIIINTGQNIYLLNALTGKLTSKAKLFAQVTDGPVISGKMAIFGGVNGQIFAHSLQTGYSRWTAELPTAVLVRPIVSGPNVFVTDAQGVYTLLSLTTGERVWTGRTFAKISAKPVASDTTQLVYIPSQDQNVYAVSRTTGKDRWIYRTNYPVLKDLAIFGNTLFVNQPDGLAAVDAISGELLWKRPGNYRPIDLIDQRLIVNAGVYLSVLDVATGQTIREATLVEPIKSILRGPDDSLILVTSKGRVTRIDPQH